MLISQVRGDDGSVSVAVRGQGSAARLIPGCESVHALALAAIDAGCSIVEMINRFGMGDAIDLVAAYTQGRLLAPVSHPDPAHLHLTGTGLTHLGSAETRDSMHRQAAAEPAAMTDSMRMFQMGIEGGKPEQGKIGVQPEWFYKGNGLHVVAPGSELSSPSFALDGGEEPELAGIYVIGPDGTPFRIGFAVANEFSDHITERQNYLYLAHSKLRQASFGPEIRLGAPPPDVHGVSRIIRDSTCIWEKPFLSGEQNMSHTFSNLEYHHFKYDLFRMPGDVHVHMFGTATLSFADGVTAERGDVFEIAAEGFGMPLRNGLRTTESTGFNIRQL